MIYFIIAATLFAWCCLATFFIGTEYQNRKRDSSEIAEFKALSKAERREALAKAKKTAQQAGAYCAYMSRLWAGYKWGYKRNPYMIPHIMAQGECIRAHKRVSNFEHIISETDNKSA